MIPHLFYYQLVILGLLWLCVMLHLAWPRRAAVSPQKPVEPESIKPKRKPSLAPQPFQGLPQTPPGTLCVHEAAHLTLSSPVRPAPMPHRTNVLVRWIPPGIFARIRPVTIAAG